MYRGLIGQWPFPKNSEISWSSKTECPLKLNLTKWGGSYTVKWSWSHQFLFSQKSLSMLTATHQHALLKTKSQIKLQNWKESTTLNTYSNSIYVLCFTYSNLIHILRLTYLTYVYQIWVRKTKYVYWIWVHKIKYVYRIWARKMKYVNQIWVRI